MFVVRRAPRAQTRQPVNFGAVSYHSRHTSRLAAAPNDSDTTTRKPAVPVLPPRKHNRQPVAADKTDDTGKPDTSSSKGPPKRKRPRNSQQQPQFPGGGGPTREYMQERALAGLLAYTGMMGTVATVISFIVPGLHLFGNFHLDTNDMLLGLKLMAPVFLLNILLMFPNYSFWQLPDPSAESKQQMAEALTKFQNSRASRRRGSSSSSSEAAESGVTAVSTDNGPPAAEPAADGSQHEAADHFSTTATTSSSSSSDGNEGTSSAPAASSSASADQASTPAKVSSSSRPGDLALLWAQLSASSSSSSSSQSSWWQDQVSKSPALSRTKDALFLAQGHCLAMNPAVILPPAVQAAVLVTECLAEELLYRSVTLQLTGGWINDRLYEAGADDLLAAVTANLPVQPGTQVAGQLIALALLSSAWGVAVLQRVFHRRRPLVVGALGVQGKGNKEAADQLLQELRKSSEQQPQQQQHSSKLDDAAASSSSNSSEGAQAEAGGRAADMDQQEKLSSSSSSVGSQSDVHQQQTQLAASEQQPQQQQQKQQQLQESSQQQQQQQKQKPLDKRQDLQDPQWSRRTIPATVSAMSWSHLICGVRDISDFTALGLGFVLTGNLAAPVAAAVVNKLLFTALQKRAVERARKRSHAIAHQLAGLARQLRDMQRKQLEAKRQQEAQKQPQQQQLSSVAVTGLQDHSGDRPVMKTADSEQEQVAVDVLHGSDAAGDDAVGSAGSVLGSRMDRTINALDQLLGEQLDGPAAAGPGSSGK